MLAMRGFTFLSMLFSLYSVNFAFIARQTSSLTNLHKKHAFINPVSKRKCSELKMSILSPMNTVLDQFTSTIHDYPVSTPGVITSLLLSESSSTFDPSISYDPSEQMLVSSTTSFTILVGFLFFLLRVRGIQSINEKIRVAEKEKNRIQSKIIFGEASKEDEELASARLDQLQSELINARTLVSINNFTLSIPAPDNGPSSQGMRGSQGGASSQVDRSSMPSSEWDQLDSERGSSSKSDWRVVPVQASGGTQLFRILFGVAIISALLSVLALFAVDPISSTKTTATNLPLV